MCIRDRIQGAHNQIQIIAIHGVNAAETKPEEVEELTMWAAARKEEFSRNCPQGTTVLAGDLRAATRGKRTRSSLRPSGKELIQRTCSGPDTRWGGRSQGGPHTRPTA
eukprot:TRINITY_DN4649_c0_g1_i4.p2 TRINITY_DN4649_c0_g1~~TRINITY_DN4649_c0_g1_i4.p2  ORF type:complete len:108 (+),score=11.56 TRINITY_DN4649_c0_g1_i4:171-494(+)